MESIIFTIILSLSVSSPKQLLERITQSLMDTGHSQVLLDSVEQMDLSDSEQARYFLLQGYIYDTENKLSEALLNYHESLRYMKRSGINSEESKYATSSLLNNIGRIYFHYSNQDLALKYYRESLQYTNENEKGSTLYNIALSQSMLENNKEAISTLLDAFTICSKYDQIDWQAKIQMKIGSILRISGDKDKSIEYFSKVINQEADLNKRLVAQAHNQLGITYWEKDKPEIAEKHFTRALDQNISSEKYLALLNLCEMHLQYGLYYRALEIGREAEQIIQEQISNPENLKLYTFISKAYEAIDEYSRALSYSNKYQEETLSYYNQQTATIDTDEAYWIQMVTDNYFTKVKSIEDKKNSIVANIIVTVTILIAFISFLWYQQAKKKKMVKKISEELLA